MKEVAQWLADEGRAAGYEVELWPEDAGDTASVQALFCIAEQWEERAERLHILANAALSKGMPVIWAVEGMELPGAFRSFTDFSQLPDAAPLLEALLALPIPEEVEEEKPPKRLSIPSRLTDTLKEIKRVRTAVEPQDALPDVLEHVIAVGGPSGCGVSFIAWNLAAALDVVLMEGRTTGTLAKWLRVDEEGTREAFLNGELDTKLAVTAEAPLSKRELQLLAGVGQTVVVDAGEPGSDIWNRAKKRVLVVTPDPRYEGMVFEEGTIRVMNRYPEAFPVSAEHVFNVKVDLVVPDLGREAFLSLWSRVPWITRQPQEVMEQWRALAGTARKEETAWSSSW
jgi:hypothetical protein